MTDENVEDYSVSWYNVDYACNRNITWIASFSGGEYIMVSISADEHVNAFLCYNIYRAEDWKLIKTIQWWDELKNRILLCVSDPKDSKSVWFITTAPSALFILKVDLINDSISLIATLTIDFELYAVQFTEDFKSVWIISENQIF